MTGSEITSLLRLVGSSLTHVARKRGDKNISTVSEVVHYRSKNPEIRADIAAEFGLPVDEVFNNKPCTITILRKLKLVNVRA